MPRQASAQKNFRCQPHEKEAYEALAEELGKPFSQIVRKELNRLVRKHLGAEWLEEAE